MTEPTKEIIEKYKLVLCPNSIGKDIWLTWAENVPEQLEKIPSATVFRFQQVNPNGSILWGHTTSSPKLTYGHNNSDIWKLDLTELYAQKGEEFIATKTGVTRFVVDIEFDNLNGKYGGDGHTDDGTFYAFHDFLTQHLQSKMDNTDESWSVSGFSIIDFVTDVDYTFDAKSGWLPGGPLMGKSLHPVLRKYKGKKENTGIQWSENDPQWLRDNAVLCSSPKDGATLFILNDDIPDGTDYKNSNIPNFLYKVSGMSADYAFRFEDDWCWRYGKIESFEGLMHQYDLSALKNKLKEKSGKPTSLDEVYLNPNLLGKSAEECHFITVADLAKEKGFKYAVSHALGEFNPKQSIFSVETNTSTGVKLADVGFDKEFVPSS